MRQAAARPAQALLINDRPVILHMTPERYRQIGDIYLAALELDLQRRAAFLDEACAGDDCAARRSGIAPRLGSGGGGFHFGVCPRSYGGRAGKGSGNPARGKRFSHYLILSLLGTGGMAEVYLAEDMRLRRKVALKLLPAAFTRDVDRARRFEQEARTVSALNHPNIVTIYEIGRFNGRQYIATELVEGSTLRDR